MTSLKRLNQRIGRQVLHQISIGAGGQRIGQTARAQVCRQHDHPGIGQQCPQTAHRLGFVVTAVHEIEQHELGPETRFGNCDTFADVARLGNDLEW